MKVRLLIICLLLAGLVEVSFADSVKDNQREIQISMSALKAAKVAMQQFEIDQPGIDQSKFYVVIKEMGDSVEVNFVPIPVPIKEGYKDGVPYINVQAGGANSNGREIHYVLSKDALRILKTTYSR